MEANGILDEYLPPLSSERIITLTADSASATVQRVPNQPLHLPPEAYEDLERVVANPDSLREISVHVDQLRTATTLHAAVKCLATVSTAGEREIEEILAALMALSSLRRNVEKEVVEYLDLLDCSIEANATQDWKQKNISNWKSCRPSLQILLDSESALSLLEKANRLGYSHARTLLRTEIIADLRPIFNTPATSIERMSVSFVLSIEYSDGGRIQSLDLALDLKDIARLRKQSARAETKAASLKTALQGQPWLTTVVGDDENGD